jgi:hypothetical protein
LAQNGLLTIRDIVSTRWADVLSEDDEQQQLLWVYLSNSFTRPGDDSVKGPNTGECAMADQGACSDPFAMVPVGESEEICTDIPWSGFEFPYWWGEPNVGFWYPTVCGNTCVVGTDHDDPPQEVAHWPGCAELAQKLSALVVAPVDDVGTEPVSVENLVVTATLY